MGREIRRVPAGWEHPRSKYNGNYIPLYDETIEDAFAEWMAHWEAWQRGDGQAQVLHGTEYTFHDYYGQSPDPESYRPAWDDAPCYQVYETVSEGTPTSPVFDNLHDLAAWLVEQGHSVLAAEQFIQHGSAPSFIVTGGVLHSGIDAMGLL